MSRNIEKEARNTIVCGFAQAKYCYRECMKGGLPPFLGTRENLLYNSIVNKTAMLFQERTKRDCRYTLGK